MSLSASVYRKQSLTTAERAEVVKVDLHSGQPLIGDCLSQPVRAFLAAEIFIGNLSTVAEFRGVLEQSAPTQSEVIRALILRNGTESGNAIGREHVLAIAAECSNILSHVTLRSSPVETFLSELANLAAIAIAEDSPIALI